MFKPFKAISKFIQKVAKAFTPKPSKPAPSKPSATASHKPTSSGTLVKTASAGHSSASGLSTSTGTASSSRSGKSTGNKKSSESGSKPKPVGIIPVSSELQVAASGNRLGQNVLRALQHEGKPHYISNEQFLQQRFARTGWNKGETDQARKVLELWEQPVGNYRSDSRVSFSYADAGGYSAEGEVSLDECEASDTVCHLVAIQHDLENARSQYTPEDDARIRALYEKLNSGQPLTQAERDELDGLEAEFQKNNQLEADRNKVLATLLGVDEELLTNAYISEYGQENIWEVIGQYQQQLQDEYGITVTGYDWGFGSGKAFGRLDHIAIRFETLFNYQQGAQDMARWLKITFADHLSNLSEAEAFRLVMGNMVVERSNEEPSDKSSWGWTSDHLILDRFDIKALENRGSRYGINSPMTGNIFLHELAHAFVNSSGFGSWFSAPIYDPTQTDQMEQILGDLGEGVPGTANEAMANFIESLANGSLTLQELEAESFDIEAFNASLDQALVANVLRNTAPANLPGELGEFAIDTVASPGQSIYTTSSGSTMLNPDTTTTNAIIALAQAPSSDNRVYVAINRGGYFDYGWVDRSVVSITDEQFATLPKRTIEGIAPFSVQGGQLIYTG